MRIREVRQRPEARQLIFQKRQPDLQGEFRGVMADPKANPATILVEVVAPVGHIDEECTWSSSASPRARVRVPILVEPDQVELIASNTSSGRVPGTKFQFLRLLSHPSGRLSNALCVMFPSACRIRYALSMVKPVLWVLAVCLLVHPIPSALSLLIVVLSIGRAADSRSLPMRVLVTGHNGYIGSVMVQVLARAGHQVSGLDTYLFETCTFGETTPDIPSYRLDLRDVQTSHLQGFDAVIHLAAISNDPQGTSIPKAHTTSITWLRCDWPKPLARHESPDSCSPRLAARYGLSGGNDLLTEEAQFNPITPYGESKVLVERDVSRLATADFSPVFLRNATAYGVSPRLRADIVVNNLVGRAFTTGEIRIESDGTPWRPLVHIEDISRAFLAVLEAPREAVHNQAFNVGQSTENYRISEIAEMVLAVVPSSKVTYAEGGGPDPRCYRVDCSRITDSLPSFRPTWTVPDGVRELYEAYCRYGLTYEEFVGSESRYLRIRHIQRLQQAGQLTKDLRWTAAVGANEVLEGASH